MRTYGDWATSTMSPLPMKWVSASMEGSKKKGGALYPNTSEGVNLRTQIGIPEEEENCSRAGKRKTEKGVDNLGQGKNIGREEFLPILLVFLSLCIWNFLDANVHTPYLLCARHCAKHLN